MQERKAEAYNKENIVQVQWIKLHRVIQRTVGGDQDTATEEGERKREEEWWW